MGHNRYGVVVGAAVEPKAVRRYRLKRQIAEAARAWPPVSLDCVFIFSRVANQLSSLELRAELERAREAVSGFSARRRPTQQ